MHRKRYRTIRQEWGKAVAQVVGTGGKGRVSPRLAAADLGRPAHRREDLRAPRRPESAVPPRWLPLGCASWAGACSAERPFRNTCLGRTRVLGGGNHAPACAMRSRPGSRLPHRPGPRTSRWPTLPVPQPMRPYICVRPLAGLLLSKLCIIPDAVGRQRGTAATPQSHPSCHDIAGSRR